MKMRDEHWIGLAAAIMATALLLSVAIVLSGCATLDDIRSNDRAQYIAVQRTFTGVVDALADLREQGTFSVEQADQITMVIRAGRVAFAAWADALVAGHTDTGAQDAALQALQKLAAYQGGT